MTTTHTNTITKTIVYSVENEAGARAEFHYNDSLTINVFLIDDEGRSHEVDVMTLSEPGEDRALAAIRDYIDDPAQMLMD